MKKLARVEASSICRPQFANVFADCFCAVHTHQLEFANTDEFANFSLLCEVIKNFEHAIVTQAEFQMIRCKVTGAHLMRN